MRLKRQERFPQFRLRLEVPGFALFCPVMTDLFRRGEVSQTIIIINSVNAGQRFRGWDHRAN
jgi:hypothetical protein